VKFRPVGPHLFYEDRDMDRKTDERSNMMKLIVAFSNFAKHLRLIYGILTWKLCLFES
jgi:hypothetical protein